MERTIAHIFISGFYRLYDSSGAGKTTTCETNCLAKAEWKKPMLCACDVYRPAAMGS